MQQKVPARPISAGGYAGLCVGLCAGGQIHAIGAIESDCPCMACGHSRAYMRHLFLAGEMLGPILASIHNLTFYQRLMRRLREAIVAGQFQAVRADILARMN